MYDYVGRVRPWDGLIVLVRTPVSDDALRINLDCLCLCSGIFNQGHERKVDGFSRAICGMVRLSVGGVKPRHQQIA